MNIFCLFTTTNITNNKIYALDSKRPIFNFLTYIQRVPIYKLFILHLGTSLSTIYQPKQKGRRLDWELFPGKGDLSLAALLEGNRGSAGRRHRKPSTSRGKFRKLGQDSEDEESAAMLRHDSIEERSGEEMA